MGIYEGAIGERSEFGGGEGGGEVYKYDQKIKTQ
jgi:hypothetical protein